MKLIDPTVKYDKLGRMIAHPVYHPRTGKPWTLEEMIYLCKFHEYDGMKDISFGIGRAEKACQQKLVYLRKSGEYWKYKDFEGDY